MEPWQIYFLEQTVFWKKKLKHFYKKLKDFNKKNSRILTKKTSRIWEKLKVMEATWGKSASQK